MCPYSILFLIKIVGLQNREKLKRFRIVLLTLSIHVSCQCDLLVDTVADFAFVFAVILESDVVNLQVRADYLIVLPANRNADKNN